ncbi:carcinoembryonic antigen-related cell adhesion molecule 6-like isoform X1 [Megalobrama amblycephala]|uniref:carcinoembryonic antigen-related cell adhesion molecule 6-like isoform X1 n=1 Tax=Megalobrama amblycephala TaxID=75352 RepID=UPI002013DE2E|nr:carcinoembryonic antigen-related cell adhesion molecule 6-like isoform X1 [Megalobrama amblycephala]
MMVSYRLYWTLWILSCFGQYLGQDLQIPEPPNKEEGDTVVFTPDNPPPSTSIIVTQWIFGTTPIITAVSGRTTVNSDYEDRAIFDSNTLALELRNLRHNDSGIYKLSVTPTAGAIITVETSLQVEKLSVNLTGPEEPLIEGESSANINSEGNGNIISVQWMKNNSPLSPSSSIIFSPDNRSVSISPVQRSDSGEYQCKYTNPVNSETATYSLIINYGPEDVSIKGLGEVNSGAPVSLSCSANSVPSASFRWTFNGTNTGVTTDTYTIDKTDFTDSGDYDCTAWNSVTNRSASQRHVLLVKAGGGGGGLSTGAIVGIVIGVLVAVAAICGLIVYLIKTKKMPKLTLPQNGRSSGAAAQRRQEPDLNYADISHFQKGSGERVILGNRGEPNTEYAEVKRSGTKSTAPPPPYGSQVSNPPLRRDLQLLLSPQEDGGHV